MTMTTSKEGKEGVFGTAAEVSWSPLPLTLHSLQSPTLMTNTNTTFTNTTTDPSQWNFQEQLCSAEVTIEAFLMDFSAEIIIIDIYTPNMFPVLG